ncbi:unnamed protein product [Heterobilharzia americana]|nr:unnamed protein product [Heterobilharzia americana]
MFSSKIIHSVLSDTEFTELLVSDLPNNNLRNRINDLSSTFHLEEEYLNAPPDDTTVPRSHHHYHYHHHLGTHQVRLLNYLDGVTSSPSDGTSLFMPPIIFPPDTNIPQSRAVNIIDASSHIPYRWNSELGSAENHSIPVPQESDLTRDTSPEFLAANETHRHRLASFIRRELRVLAPWLSYEASYSSQGNREDSEDTGFYNAAVTAPLISGAPGLEVETRELDDLTNIVLQHLCTVPITNEQALVSLLASQPALHSSLVPSVYLRHLASEILQFAQFTGSMEEYDSSISLYRRRITLSGLVTSTERNRNRHPQRFRLDPRLAVYIASACWPRIRPGFTQPEGLIVHPLINWLLQRLFVHAVSGTSHPDPLPGTGDPPPTLPSPLVFHGPSLTCHPNCLRLASSSHALLEAIISFSRLRGPTAGRTINLSPDVAVSVSEIFPNRLLYQRILSELIDHARFSEALSGQFSQYNDRTRVTSLTSQVSEENRLNSVSSNLIGNRVSIRNLISVSEPATCLQPAIRSYPFALRRLDGLLLLFTARVPGLRNDPEHLVSELLHMPLMPMTITPLTVIDLTNSRTAVSRSQTFPTQSESRSQSSENLDTVRAPYASRFSGIDWKFLRQLPFSSYSQSDPPPSSSTTSNRVSSDSGSTYWSPSISSQPTASSDASPFPGSQLFSLLSSVGVITPVEVSTSTHNSPSGWRETAPCVVISSDSSDEESVDYHGTCEPPIESNVLTSDESESEHNSSADNSIDRCDSTASLGSLFKTFSNMPLQKETSVANESSLIVLETENNKTNSHSVATGSNVEAINIQNNTTTLSINSSPTCTHNANSNWDDIICDRQSSTARREEPMEVDERLDEVSYVSIPSSSDFRTSLCNPSAKSFSTASEGKYTMEPHPPKHIEATSSASRSNILSPRNSLKQYYHPQTKQESHHHRKRKVNINIENTDSDCELVRESIRIDSDSSCLTFRSTSSRSSSSSDDHHHSLKFSPSVIRFCSPSYRRKNLCRRHRHCRHNHYKCCRHTCHYKHSCCCYCRSKLHKRPTHRHPQDPDKLVNLNNPSSPVIISDDDSDESNDIVLETGGDSALTNQHLYSPNQGVAQKDVASLQSKLSHDCLANEDNSLSFSTDTSVLDAASCHPIGECSSPSKVYNTESSSKPHVSPVNNLSSSATNFPIFEPPTASEFYRLMAKFEDTKHSESSASEIVPVRSSLYDKCNQTDDEISHPSLSTPSNCEKQSTSSLSVK